jgi:hypothetical protein
MKMSDEQVASLYKFYVKETIRLLNIKCRTKNRRIKFKLFARIMKLKDKYDWTYDEIYRRRLLQFK